MIIPFLQLPASHFFCFALYFPFHIPRNKCRPASTLSFCTTASSYSFYVSSPSRQHGETCYTLLYAVIITPAAIQSYFRCSKSSSKFRLLYRLVLMSSKERGENILGWWTTTTNSSSSSSNYTTTTSILRHITSFNCDE